ncbi:MAG: SurA N-terminal domain-containing protein [Alistipes sp.]|nr:SurA N-terminal domain-containing protein [Alistipes sp.]
MASLNTLRTKFGAVLTVVIVLALLAFILSLGPEMGFLGSNDPTVGVIDGNKVGYMEYMKTYEGVKSANNGDESTEERAAALANATWQELIAKHFFVPGFTSMGVEVSQAERLAMLSGEHPSQVFYQAFADPQTGEYNVEAVSAFLSQMGANPEYRAMWEYLDSQAIFDRQMNKYAGLIKAGTYANALEVAHGVKVANESRNGRFVAVKYTSIPDSLVEVSAGDVKKYYEAHKEQYRKLPNRSLNYVVFDVAPTQEDMQAIEAKAKGLGEEFAVAEDVRAFVRKNMGQIAPNYAQIADEAEAVMLNGKMYGPELKSNEWVMSRALDVKMLPDSIGLSHIVIPATDAALADSLYTALKGGASFAEAAKAHSVYAASAQNGGEVGVMPFSALSTDLVEELADAKKGSIVKVAMGDAIQIFKVTRVDAKKKHALVGTITIPVEASSETRRNIHSTASIMAVDGKGSLENFENAAAVAAVTPRIARVAQGDRLVSGLENSREVVRWANGAKEGEISEIFNLGDAYVVAMLTGIDDSKYQPLDETRKLAIAQTLRRDKKFDMLKAKYAGKSLEEIAGAEGVEVANFENIKYTDFAINDTTFEPAATGAIATTEAGVLSQAKGNGAAVFFVVEEVVAETEAPRTAEEEKARLQTTNENMSIQYAMGALQNMVEIEDLRGKYF